MGKNIGNSISKTLSGKHTKTMSKYVKNVLIMLNILLQLHLKLLQKVQFNKQLKQLVI